MSSEREGSQHSPVTSDDIRRRVVEAVHDAKTGRQPLGGHGELDIYLALLQDRLPVYVGTRRDLLMSVGQASVEKNLTLVALATIDFYRAVLPAKISVLADPAQLARLKQIMQSHEMGQRRADQAIAVYLQNEQEAGRIAPDVHPSGSARLLISACLNYVFTCLLAYGDTAPPAEDYVAEAVLALRLTPPR
jgi:hypothetical protein